MSVTIWINQHYLLRIHDIAEETLTHSAITHCIDFSLISQAGGLGSVTTSWTLGDVIVNTLARKARYMGSIPVVGAIFPILLTNHWLP